MRAAITARVSLDPRGEGRSVTEQVAECRAWAAREGWDVVHEISETGSASRFARSTQARTGWGDIVDLVTSGTIDILLTWEASRATRQLGQYAELADLCAKHHVLWGYSGTVYDLATRDGRFRTGLDALLAEDESARSSERVRRASRARAVAGTPHGKLPYGYRREYDPTTGALLRQVPDETTAPVAREIIRRVADGATLYAIALDLTQRAVPLPRPARGRHNAGAWIPTTVRRIAASPTYAGKRIHRGTVVGDATWEPLVDEVTHQRALAALDGMNGRAPRADRTVKHLLSGIARCGRCNGPMVRHINRGTPTYMCKSCMKVCRAQAPVDDLVIDVLMHALAELHTTPTVTDDPARTDAQAELDALETRMSSFIDTAAEGALSASALARVESRLRPQIDAAQRRLRALSRPSALTGYDFTDPAALWAALGIADRRRIVAAVLDVTIQPAGRGKRVFDPDLVVIRPRW
jgi:site-specific DNA recombinase